MLPAPFGSTNPSGINGRACDMANDSQFKEWESGGKSQLRITAGGGGTKDLCAVRVYRQRSAVGPHLGCRVVTLLLRSLPARLHPRPLLPLRTGPVAEEISDGSLPVHQYLSTDGLTAVGGHSIWTQPQQIRPRLHVWLDPAHSVQIDSSAARAARNWRQPLAEPVEAPPHSESRRRREACLLWRRSLSRSTPTPTPTGPPSPRRWQRAKNTCTV